jgi:hypothetical protein
MKDHLQVASTGLGWFVIAVTDDFGEFMTVGSPWATREQARRYLKSVRGSGLPGPWAKMRYEAHCRMFGGGSFEQGREIDP